MEDRQIGEEIRVTENDIPGAKLAKSVEDCNCAELRRWLLCRGAKTTGKRADLKRRVKDYVKNGLDKKYLRDPDGGINLLRKKAQAGVLSALEPDQIDAFPKEGYSVDLSKAPKISFGTVWRFMIETVAFKKQVATAKPLVKGYNFFKSKHVLGMYYLSKNGKHFIRSQVLPSMKKSAVYTCYIAVSSFSFVLRAKCGCPAGIDGRCNHVAATLFTLEALHKTSGGSEVSCTSKPCGWSVPPKRQGPVTPISAIKFRKHDYQKEEKKTRQPMFSPGKDVRAPHQQECSDQRIKVLLEKLKDMQESSGKAIGWCHVLPQETKRREESQENEESKNETCEFRPDSSNEFKLISPIKSTESPISLEGIKERCARIKKKLSVTSEEARKIENETRQQSACAAWHQYRKFRITASKSHRIAVLKRSTSPTKAIKECLYSNMKPTKAMTEGLAKEDEISELYKSKQVQSGHVGLQVVKSGFVVSKCDGFLGASPDGIVYDPSVEQPNGLVELKFIQTDKFESLEDALIKKRICVKKSDGVLQMNRQHQYYYQVIQTMYVTERQWSDFVVKGSTYPELYVERVAFDTAWWDNIKRKLQCFFDRHLCPELAYPRIKFGLPRLEF